MGNKYYGQIDTLRFVAVFLVLAEHFATSIGERLHAGFFGVSLFFVISGFLITNTLLQSVKPFGSSLKLFMGRRLLRIVPVYYLLIFFLYILGYEFVRQYLWVYLLFAYNYASVYFSIPLNFTSHLWTIAVEEQFYLLWPFLVLPLRRSLRTLSIVCLVVIAVCGVQLVYPVFPSQSAYWVGLFPQAYFLVLGGLGAIINKGRRINYQWMNAPFIEVLMFIAPVLLLTTKWGCAILIAPVFFLLIVMKIVNGGFRIGIINYALDIGSLRYIGKISYGVYLYHLPIAYYVGVYVLEPLMEQYVANSQSSVGHFVYGHNWVLLFPLYTILTIAVASISYKYIEVPVLKLKDKYFRQ